MHTIQQQQNASILFGCCLALVFIILKPFLVYYVVKLTTALFWNTAR